MSTLKSSAEHLTLNADGSGNDIKFQSNATQVAAIDQAGNLTLSGTVDGVDIQTLNTTAGAALPKAGGTMTGTLAFSGGNISHASHLTIDVVGNINLDSDGGLVRIQDNGNDIAAFEHGGAGLFAISTLENNADMVFKGKDGGSVIEALKFDMSDAGYATFNAGAHLKGATMIAYNSDPTLVLRRTGNAAGNGSIDFQGNDGSVDYSITAAGSTAGTLQFSTATSNAMTLNANGYLGIGTTGPLTKLHVYGDTWADATSNQGGLSMYAGSASTSAPIYFNNEMNTSAKAIYQEAYYLVIRGHDNEGIKFKGNGSSPATRYQFNMGNNGNTCYNAANSSSWNTTSDSRIKENIVTLPSGSLAKINSLRPVTFDYTDDWATKMGWYEFSKNNPDDPNDLTNDGFDLTQKNNDIGWIAQEYKTIFPQDIKTSESTVGEDTYSDFHTMKPDSLLPHLVKAIQELSTENEALKARLTAGGL